MIVADPGFAAPYFSHDDLRRKAVRLHRERKLHELRKQIEAGLQDVEQGDVTECADDTSLREFFEQFKASRNQHFAAKQGARCPLRVAVSRSASAGP
jgi:hypothetical protein